KLSVSPSCFRSLIPLSARSDHLSSASNLIDAARPYLKIDAQKPDLATLVLVHVFHGQEVSGARASQRDPAYPHCVEPGDRLGFHRLGTFPHPCHHARLG